jgi:hypothetical protein
VIPGTEGPSRPAIPISAATGGEGLAQHGTATPGVSYSLIVFQNGHISGALAELIRSTRAPTKGQLMGKIMGGNPVFRGTRVPVHMLAELVPSRVRAHALPVGKCRLVPNSAPIIKSVVS